MSDPPKLFIVGQTQVDVRRTRRPRGGTIGAWYQYEVARITITSRRLERAGFRPGMRLLVTAPRPGTLIIQALAPAASTARSSSRRG